MDDNNRTPLIAGGVLAACVLVGVLVLAGGDSADNECPDGICKPKVPAPVPTPPKPNTPRPAPKPKPRPQPKPRPGPRPCPSTDARCSAVGGASYSSNYATALDDEGGEKSSWVNGREWEQEVLTADFPGSLYIQNIGSHKDGLGMCVMTSITMLAHYLGLKDYYGLRDWCANEPGGAYRQKVEDQIARYERAMGITNPVPYLNYEGPSPEPVLDELDAARLPYAHTYGWSPRYGHRISHMVAGTKFNGKYAVVLDNNPMKDFDPATNHIFEWMSRAEMVRRAKLGGGNMWIFAWLAPPPPPCPKVQ